MYYATIGILALLILLIENQDILLNRNKAFDNPSWKAYRRFLITIIVYYVTDILWGFLESQKLAALLFADTSFYFFSMAIGVLFWTQYVVLYLNENSGFERFLVYAGRIIAIAVGALSIVNIFFPLLFSVDADGTYHALTFRYVILISQIVLLIVIVTRMFIQIFRKRDDGEKRQKYMTIAQFGIIMVTFMILQAVFPFLPCYAIAYLLGTCLVRAFVIRDEREAYRKKYDETREIRELKASISALLDNMPALSFSKDAKTGVYLACNQAFAEYAHKESPEGVIGLTDAEIFNEETARHFAEDDKMALSMEEPYIFYEDVPDAAGNQRQFQTTKLKFSDGEGKLCILGMCQDMTDMVRIQREHATTKEAYEKARNDGIIFTHIAQTLAHGYEDLYYINLETEEFIEYHPNDENGALAEVRHGSDFFASCVREADIYVYPADREMVLRALNRETLLQALDRNNVFIMTYRLLSGEDPVYVTMKVSRMEDDERFIILGVTDVDDQVKERKAVEKAREERAAYLRLNALSGDFIAVYVVDPKTDDYHEFSATTEYKSFDLAQAGQDFFGASRKQIGQVIYPEDLERFLSYFTRENVLSEVERSGLYVMSYRLMIGGKPTHVRLKASMVEEAEGQRLIVGINDIDSHVRKEEDYARRLAQAQAKANIDAMTGVRNKHAYLDEEERLDLLIEEHREPEFAIVILDVNNLKMVNDTQGHQAGDEYIRKACRIICDTFKRSPVFRVGGDEFAVVVEGDDYASIRELIGRISDHNEEAARSGGVVVACGMARYDGDDCVASVFERADIAMYENKAALKA